MAHVGLVFVGLILLVNGLVALKVIAPRQAALLNLMVGSLQILLPTLILIQAAGNIEAINGAWPSYLFGMTYLQVGLNALCGFESKTLGVFSGFVAAIALYETAMMALSDPVNAVIWFSWALMWACFLVRDGLGMARIGAVDVERFTGWLLVLGGIPSSTIPSLFAQNGLWSTAPAAGLLALAGLGVVLVTAVFKAQKVPAQRARTA